MMLLETTAPPHTFLFYIVPFTASPISANVSRKTLSNGTSHDSCGVQWHSTRKPCAS